MHASPPPCIVRDLGVQDYFTCYHAMKTFTDTRTSDTPDEIWLLEHPPIFTQGQNGRPENIFQPGDIPVVQTDRGGQVTYHGPGQLIVYTLINLAKKKYTVRQMVSDLENAVIALLSSYGIAAVARREAPGVYVNQKKIASVGLRIRRGCSYHGLALNIDMDLEPFSRIRPCGLEGIQVTQLSDFIPQIERTSVAQKLTQLLLETWYSFSIR